MVALRKRSTMTVAEFLEWEEQQEGRYEFIDGEIVAMVGGTAAHSKIAGNVHVAVATRLRGTPCRAFQEGFKVSTALGVFYPDVFVTCTRLSDRDLLAAEPTVIFEVLSDSTERRDLTTKNHAYQSVPSVKHYFIIAQDELTVECFSRSGEGWLHSVVQGVDDVLPIPALGLELPLSDIYEDTDVLTETRAADA